MLSVEARPAGGVELGRYIVRNVASCADCHGSGKPSEDQPLSGKILHTGDEVVVAPNITPDRDTGIGAWTEGDIATYLRTGTRPDGSLAQSAMAGLIVTGFSHFTPVEAHAVAAYLKSQPPVRHRM
jgi:mono/diheme cytochrome c family protein